MVLPTNTRFVEWTCPRDVRGQIIGFSMSDRTRTDFQILEFSHVSKNGDVQQLVDSAEVKPTPLSAAVRVWNGGVAAQCFEQLIKAHGFDWFVEEGDKILVRVLNITGQVCRFDMGLLIGEAVTFSKQPHWWADESGTLKRPLTFEERGLKLGTKIGGLVVVDPHTYEGFDTTEH